MKLRAFGILSFTIILLLLNSTKIISQDKIQQAYTKLDSGKFSEAEQLFLKEQDSPEAYRADLGLFFLNFMKENMNKAWEYYYKVLTSVENPAPYIFIILNGNFFNRIVNEKDSKLLDILIKESKNKEDGFINALACESLGQFYLNHNDFEKSKEYFDKIGAIKNWSLIGPFENISASGYYQKYGPEIDFNTDTIYIGKNNKPVNWFNIDKLRNDYWIDCTLYFPTDNSIFYGNTFIYSPVEQKVQIRIGTSGSYRAFLNDRLISECYEERNNDIDTYGVNTVLQKGWNRLILKVGYSDIENCNFLVRITDDKGFPLEDLKFSNEKKDYNTHTEVSASQLSIPYEKYFEEKIKQHPDHFENYAMLAGAYLKNEKFEKAEELLENGLKKSPDNLLLMYELLSLYTKSKMTTEQNTICEKINSINENIPAVLGIKIMNAVNNKNQDKYTNLIEKALPLIPESPELYLMETGYYALKNQPSKVIECINDAYKKYPNEWNIVAFKERFDYTASRDYNEAINTVGKFCKNNYSYEAFKELANLYLLQSKIDKWDSTYNQIIKHDPAAPGYHYQMAKDYYSLRQYANAEKAIKEAIHICPFSSSYYETLGDDYAALNETDSAKVAYRSSIKFSSTNYDAREKLKNLQNVNTEDDDIKPFDIKDLIKNSPSADKYPGDDALILCNDVKRTFYEGGASEYDVEILIKIFTKDGIEHYTDYDIDYNSNVQNLIFDKAVVIKKDGSEIDADKNDGEVVFKSLDVNDCIYLKYKIRNYYTGELVNHFWDQFNFNQFYPIENIRYSLILPSDKNVYYKGQNMNSEPAVKKDLGNKTLYVWQMKDIPAVKYETGMPPLNDVGKVLYVSTIKNWNYIAGWYLHLTRSKIIPNFEIKEKVNELLQGKESLSLYDKIKIIYDYIVQNITYSSVSFRQSAFIPQKARDVLITKIGDCKDMATLFITMLKELNINADYVLVNTRDNGLNTNALPGNYFNHAIAKVVIDGKPLFFDLTARNYPAGTLPSMDIGAFALDVTNIDSKPFYIDGKNLFARKIIRNTEAVIKDDNSLLVNIRTERTGAATAATRYEFNDIGKNEQLKNLNESLSNIFNNFKVNSFSSDNLDTLTTSLSYDFSFTINQFMGNVGNYKLLKLPWEDRENSNAAISYDQRKYAYDRNDNADFYKETITIKLPTGYFPLEMPKNVSLECKEAKYSVEYKLVNGIITATRIMSNLNDIINPEDYKSYNDFINKVINSDKTQILLKKS